MKLKFNSSLLSDLELANAILAGCLACKLIKEGIDHFKPVYDLKNGEGELREYFICYRVTDSGWLVNLPGLDGHPEMVLEFVDSVGNATHV
jgi:hypothetical protein